jgi:hypothetical protein
MSLPVFLNMLFDHGRIRVPICSPIPADELAEARRVLVEFESGYRLTLPGEPPEFLVETACWAAVVLYRACQCLVYRELDVPQTLPSLKVQVSGPRQPAHHYSSDVVLRFLPDAWRLSRDVARGDPLVQYLHELAGSWPLSSVGIADVNVLHLDEFAHDRSLLAVYTDRIVERQDRSRLAEPRVRAAIRTSIGMFPDLAPEMASALEAHVSPSQTDEKQTEK